MASFSFCMIITREAACFLVRIKEGRQRNMIFFSLSLINRRLPSLSYADQELTEIVLPAALDVRQHPQGNIGIIKQFAETF